MSQWPWDEQEVDCQEPNELFVVEGSVNAAGKPWRFAAAFMSEGLAETRAIQWRDTPPRAYTYRVRRYVPSPVTDLE